MNDDFDNRRTDREMLERIEALKREQDARVENRLAGRPAPSPLAWVRKLSDAHLATWYARLLVKAQRGLSFTDVERRQRDSLRDEVDYRNLHDDVREIVERLGGVNL